MPHSGFASRERPTPMNLRRLAAAVGLFAIALTSCGGSGGNEQSADLTQANFASTLSNAVKDEKSVHIDGDVKAAGTSFTIKADTLLDKTNSQMRMSMDAGQLGAIQLVLADQVIYIKAPQISQLSNDASKPWVKIDTTDPNNPFASSFGRIFEQADPSKLPDTFKSIKGLKKVGTETVNGVETTHYAVTIDTAAAVRASGGDTSKLKSAGVPNTAKVDIWIDSEQRPAQVKMTMGSLADINLTFSHWGEDVNVTAPPANQVSELNN
jgi:lipoprotein LprG